MALYPDSAPGYQQTTWAAIHGSSGNSDYVPLAMNSIIQQRWHVLQGAGLWSPPAVSQDGTVFVTSGRGMGWSHLHAVSPDGKILWESPLQQDADDLDAGAVISTPVLDEAGDIYVGDANQFWAWHPEGRLKWVAELRPHGIKAPLISAIIVGDTVGGVSADGILVLFYRENGRLVDVLTLPGNASPPGPAMPRGLWQQLLHKDIRQAAWDILRGHRYEVTNAPAVHPRSGRIFIIGAGMTETKGHLYGIDVQEGKASIAFTTEIPAGSGTSPALSPDGRRLYAMAQGALFAVHTGNGSLLWKQPVNGQDASPSVGTDDTVYVLGSEQLTAVWGSSGALRWRRRYDNFAQAQLPTIGRKLFGLLPNGIPVATINSVISVTPSLLWTSLVTGYRVQLGKTSLIHPQQSYLVALSPEDGSMLAHYPIPDTSEGGISIGPQGEIYMDQLAAIASIAAHNPYRWLLPASLRIPPPKGGLLAFGPPSLWEHCLAGLRRAAELLRSPIAEQADPVRGEQELQIQLQNTRECAVQAERKGDISPDMRQATVKGIDTALKRLQDCRQASTDGDADSNGCPMRFLSVTEMALLSGTASTSSVSAAAKSGS